MNEHEQIERDAWLGEVRKQMSERELARWDDVARRITAAYPDEDDMYERGTALTAALEQILETGDLREIGRQLQQSRMAERLAVAAARGAVIAAGGRLPETQISKQLSVSRMTVRAWLGK